MAVIIPKCTQPWPCTKNAVVSKQLEADSTMKHTLVKQSQSVYMVHEAILSIPAKDGFEPKTVSLQCDTSHEMPRS